MAAYAASQPILPTEAARTAWVDCAKGLCIIMVVMMHSTLGVEAAAGTEGWMHSVVAFARPFRMPDFFLIAGLFLARVIDRDWRTYLDKKLVHFLYFYVIWVTIQAVVKQGYPAYVSGDWAGFGWTLASAAWDPPGTLWFIYILPIFFILAKLVRGLNPLLVLGVAALLEILPIETGWFIGDEFCSRLVYFLIGVYAAPMIFRFADRIAANPGLAIAGLPVWAIGNAAAVILGVAELPVVSLGLGMVGALAVIAFAVLLSRGAWGAPVRYCGQHSLVIYLAFFLPMAATRIGLLKTGVITDIGLISLMVTVTAVTVPLILHRVVRPTPLRFLFERPAWPRLAPARRSAMVPAE